MADLTDLKARLRYIKGVCDEAADAIEALEAELFASCICRHKPELNKVFDECDFHRAIRERAEKAEADLAAARAALRYFVGSLSEFHGGDHHDDACPDCRAMLEHAPAIAAAQAEGGE